MLDRAAKRGARAALQELGLHDENAPRDLDELRGLLSAWRDTRATMWQTAVKIITTGTLLFIAAAKSRSKIVLPPAPSVTVSRLVLISEMDIAYSLPC